MLTLRSQITGNADFSMTLLNVVFDLTGGLFDVCISFYSSSHSKEIRSIKEMKKKRKD